MYHSALHYWKTSVNLQRRLTILVLHVIPFLKNCLNDDWALINFLYWVFFQDGIIWELYSLKNLLIQIELRLGFSFFWGGVVHVFHEVSSCGVSKYLSTMYSIYLMSYDRICFHLAVDHFCCSFTWLFSAGIKFMLKGLHGLWAWSIFYPVVLFPW